jgi:hypothetical protein
MALEQQHGLHALLRRHWFRHRHGDPSAVDVFVDFMTRYLAIGLERFASHRGPVFGFLAGGGGDEDAAIFRVSQIEQTTLAFSNEFGDFGNLSF